jgi:hypothetical protein
LRREAIYMPLDILAAVPEAAGKKLTRNPDPRSLITAAPSRADFSQTTGRNRRNVVPALESAETSTNPPAAATMS